MMKAMTIVCQRCGIEGEIEFQNINRNKQLSRIFKHVGHNPYSGDLHYQCPTCEIVLLVDPMTVLESFSLGYPKASTVNDLRHDKQKTSSGSIRSLEAFLEPAKRIIVGLSKSITAWTKKTPQSCQGKSPILSR